MKKKEYIRPAVSVLQIEAQAIMVTSQIDAASHDDYTDEYVEDYWEDDEIKDIWAD